MVPDLMLWSEHTLQLSIAESEVAIAFRFQLCSTYTGLQMKNSVRYSSAFNPEKNTIPVKRREVVIMHYHNSIPCDVSKKEMGH